MYHSSLSYYTVIGLHAYSSSTYALSFMPSLLLCYYHKMCCLLVAFSFLKDQINYSLTFQLHIVTTAMPIHEAMYNQHIILINLAFYVRFNKQLFCHTAVIQSESNPTLDCIYFGFNYMNKCN